MIQRFFLLMALFVASCAVAAELQVCSSPEALNEAIRETIAPYQFSGEIQSLFARAQPAAAIGTADGQQYVYFLGRVDNIEKIPAAELDDALAFQIYFALLPQVARRITFYQTGSRMLALSRGEKSSRRISWYLNNEKKAIFTASLGNHYSSEVVTTDKLEKLDTFSMNCFDVNKTENLAVFLLKGETKSFLFFGRTPVESNFVHANQFPVSK